MAVRRQCVDSVCSTYGGLKAEIARRLSEFKAVGSADDNTIFSELCFCILTPQSRAVVCDGIIRKLTDTGLLFEGTEAQIRPHVRHARFYRNKTRYILSARNLLGVAGDIRIKDKLDGQHPQASREWLVRNIKGIGYKEASHFLRNIGMGEDLAILDIHILRHLKKLGVIAQVPRSLTRKQYFLIEDKLRAFAKKCGIPVGHLDLVFWSMATGKIFK